MNDRPTLLLEHHLKELKLAQLPPGIREAGRPVRRRGHRPPPVPAPAGGTGTHLPNLWRRRNRTVHRLS